MSKTSSTAVAEVGSLPELFCSFAQRGYVDDLDQALKESPNLLNASDNLGNTMLHLSCSSGHLNVTRLLLNKKIDLNRENLLGDTALHKASFRGYSEIVKLLLENGIDASRKNKEGKTALDITRSQAVRNLLSPPETLGSDDDDDDDN